MFVCLFVGFLLFYFQLCFCLGFFFNLAFAVERGLLCCVLYFVYI